MLRPFLTNALVFLLPAFILALVIYYQEYNREKTVLEIQAIESLQGQNEQIINEFNYIVSDLMFLAEQYELQRFLDKPTQEQRAILAREYRLFAAKKKLYDQIRFLDETGMEIARTNFNRGTPTIVPIENLQNKGKRYYFRDAFLLERGEVFISPFDLNIEKGKIERPLKPMIRFATPVFDHSGHKRGIVLLNYLGERLLKKLEQRAANASSDVMLLNAKGFWLKGTKKEQEWGFMYGRNKTFGNKFPEEWEQIIQNQSGQFDSHNGLFSFKTIYPLIEGQKSSAGAFSAFSPSLVSLGAQDYYWKMLSYVPPSTLQKISAQILNKIAIPFFALILFILIIIAFLTQSRIKHIKAETALRESEERFKAIVTAIPIPMAITRLADGCFLYANQHYSEFFNISSEQLIDQSAYNITHLSEKEALLPLLGKEGYIHDLELKTKLIDGKSYWIMASFYPMNYNGESAMIGVIYDITQRKQAEKKLQHQHEFLQHVIDSLDHPFYVIDVNTYQIGVANSATKALGLWPGATCYALTHRRSEPCTGKNDPCPLKQIKNTKKPFIVEHIHFDKAGNPRNVEVHGFPILDRHGNVRQMIEYSLDVTERKQTEEQLYKQNEELQAQNEQLDAFARQLAELQQEKLYQLNKAYERFVPSEFLGLLDKQSILDVQLGDQVEKEITVLFSDIRGFTRLSEKMNPQDNFEFINTYLGLMEPIIHQHHGFIDKYIGDAIMALFPTHADDAIKGGIAMLKKLKQFNPVLQKMGKPMIEVGIGLNTGLLMLGTVGGQNRMDGTVISDAVNLASRVEQLTKTYGTSLLITEQTYQKLNNPSDYKIRVIDRVTVKGKTEPVTIYEVFDNQAPIIIELKSKTLPDLEQGFHCFHNEEFEKAQHFFENVLQINSHDKVAQVYLAHCRTVLGMTMPEKPRILVVDDMPFNIQLLSTFLNLHDFEVLAADNGYTGLELAESKQPHLILLDILMPEIDGFETCQLLKEKEKVKDIPVIFMTALSNTGNKVKGLDLGAVDYITRPFQQEEVLARVKAHLNIRYLQQQLQAKNTELEIHNLNLKDRIKTLTMETKLF
jgi:PAS domain S-box-containing protein